MTKDKTPEELAKKEINKRLGKAIASRMLKVKEHEAAIKRIEKEITKIKSGELVPEESSDSSYDQKVIIKEIIKERDPINHWRYVHEPNRPEKPTYWTLTTDSGSSSAITTTNSVLDTGWETCII